MSEVIEVLQEEEPTILPVCESNLMAVDNVLDYIQNESITIGQMTYI